MTVQDIIRLHQDAKEALNLPGISAEDRRAIAVEFLSVLNTQLLKDTTTLRAVRASLLKEAQFDARSLRHPADTPRDAPKAPPKRKTRLTRSPS